MKVQMEITLEYPSTIQEVKEKDGLIAFNDDTLAELYAKAYRRMFDNIVTMQNAKDGNAVGVEIGKVLLYDNGKKTASGRYFGSTKS